MNEKYTKNYYLKHLVGARASANVILNVISSFYMPTSIIDFGCGAGVWLDEAKKIFHANVLGIDQHTFCEIDMLIKHNEYITHNLETPVLAKQKFDLAISVEVAEHIAEEHSNIFIESLCNHSEIILFSAALPNQGGTGHINEQPCSYWAYKFDQYGYYAIDCIRPRVWNNNNVEVWYRNNSMLFVSKRKMSELISKIPVCNYPLDIIHPQMLERIIERRN